MKKKKQENTHVFSLSNDLWFVYNPAWMTGWLAWQGKAGIPRPLAYNIGEMNDMKYNSQRHWFHMHTLLPQLNSTQLNNFHLTVAKLLLMIESAGRPVGKAASQS